MVRKATKKTTKKVTKKTTSKANPKCIGILTGGGDAPGLNAVIRGVVVKASSLGYKVLGFKRGWKGLLELDYQTLTTEDVEDIQMQGGTILGSSRTNVAKVPNGFEIAKENMKKAGVYALVASGGEDTLGVANKLAQAGGKVVGVPKTIDNDVNGTDYTFGFDTAINRAMECMDWIHTTAKSHHRVIIVEIMGRHAGWMALHSGMASAHITLIPEVPFNIDEVCRIIKKRHSRGKEYTIIAVAEGAEDPNLKSALMHSAEKDDFGHIRLGTGVTISKVLETEIEQRTGFETRSAVLGHLQRGGAPSAFDRVLGTRFGVKVVNLIEEKKWGYMVGLHGSSIVPVPLSEAVGELKTVPIERYETAKLFFG